MADKKTNKRRKSHQKDPETQPETQFESHSDDSDNMYEVVRILKEDETRYFVEWAGIDPDTGKDWAPTWVRKVDCSNDLIKEWKARNKDKSNSTKSHRSKSISSTKSNATKRTHTPVTKEPSPKRDADSPDAASVKRTKSKLENTTERGSVVSRELDQQRQVNRKRSRDSEPEENDEDFLFFNKNPRKKIRKSSPIVERQQSEEIESDNGQINVVSRRESPKSPSKKEKARPPTESVVPDSQAQPGFSAPSSSPRASSSMSSNIQKKIAKLREIPSLSPTIFKDQLGDASPSQISQFSSQEPQAIKRTPHVLVPPKARISEGIPKPKNFLDAYLKATAGTTQRREKTKPDTAKSFQPDKQLPVVEQAHISKILPNFNLSKPLPSRSLLPPVAPKPTATTSKDANPDTKALISRHQKLESDYKMQLARQDKIEADAKLQIALKDATISQLEFQLKSLKDNGARMEKLFQTGFAKNNTAIGELKTQLENSLALITASASSTAKLNVGGLPVTIPPATSLNVVVQPGSDELLESIRKENEQLKESLQQLTRAYERQKEVAENATDMARRAEATKSDLQRENRRLIEQSRTAPLAAEAFFKPMLEAAELEAQMQKQQVELLVEQNTLTDDKVRERASKYRRLADEVKKLKDEQTTLYEVLCELEEERDTLKRRLAGMASMLEENGVPLEQPVAFAITSEGTETSEGPTDMGHVDAREDSFDELIMPINDLIIEEGEEGFIPTFVENDSDEMVFLCEWHDPVTGEPCPIYFSNKEELQFHALHHHTNPV